MSYQDDKDKNFTINDTDAGERRTMGGEQASESVRGIEDPEESLEVLEDESQDQDEWEGVCACNTPPSTIHTLNQYTNNINKNNNEIIVLKTGIDSLYIGYVVDNPRPEFYSQIKKLKLNAQEIHGPLDFTIRFDEEDPNIFMNFKIEPKGIRKYPYIIRNDHYDIKIFGEGNTGFIPRVYVEIRSSTLNELGEYHARQLVEKIIESKIGQIDRKRSGVSRMDPCVDILVDESLFTGEVEDKLRCKSSKTYTIKAAGRLETLYVGSQKAPVQCRMYDKGVEREKEGQLRDYLDSVNLSEIPSGKKIVRVEFEIKRAFLTEHKLKGLDQLPKSAIIAWEYLTSEWLRVVKKKSKTNAARDENEEWWDVVKEAYGHIDFKIYKKDKHKIRINLSLLVNKIYEDVALLLAQAIIVKKPNCRNLQYCEITLQKGFEVWEELFTVENLFTPFELDIEKSFPGIVKREIEAIIGRNRKVRSVRQINPEDCKEESKQSKKRVTKPRVRKVRTG